MKMDPNITDQITIEANYLVCSATEIFIRQLVKDAFQANSVGGKETLDYRNLAKYVQDHENLDFLHAVLPNKITVKEYKKILAEETEKDANSGSDYESSEEDDSDEEEEEAEDEEESGEEEEEAANAVVEIDDD
jgi:chromatin accessibility complex protein 1